MSDASMEAPHERNGRYQVLALLCLMAGVAYVQRAAISVPIDEIASDLQLANLAKDMGWVQFTWYFAYAMLQLPSGWFADRLGSRRALAVLAIAWSLATLTSGLATGFTSLLILWGLMGAAQAGAFPCAAKAIGQLFPETERARASGFLASGMMVGGALAPVLTGMMLELLRPAATALHVDRWRLLLGCCAIPGIAWTLLFLAVVPERRLPARLSKWNTSTSIDWSRLVRSKSLALLCGQQFFRAAAMVFFLTWFPKFLKETRGVSTLESSLLTTIAGVGGVAGSLSGGVVSDWLLRRTGNERFSRQGIAVVGMATCASLILASSYVGDVRGSIALITLGVFCATFGGVSGYTVAIKLGGRHVATVFSSMNMCGNLGAALFPLAAGWLVNWTHDWNLLLPLFAGIMAVDAICWALLNPKGTLFEDDDPMRKVSAGT